MKKLFLTLSLTFLSSFAFLYASPAKAQSFNFEIHSGYAPVQPRYYQRPYHHRPQYPQPHFRPAPTIPFIVAPFGGGGYHQERQYARRCHMERRFVDTPYGVKRRNVRVCYEG